GTRSLPRKSALGLEEMTAFYRSLGDAAGGPAPRLRRANSPLQNHASMGGSYAVLVDFLEFIDQGRTYPLEVLLGRVLLKARQITHAEAGTIFIVRQTGAERQLEPGSVQNDAIPIAR